MFCDNQFKGEVSISNIFSLEKRKVCIKVPFPMGKIVLIIFMNWERKSNLIVLYTVYIHAYGRLKNLSLKYSLHLYCPLSVLLILCPALFSNFPGGF